MEYEYTWRDCQLLNEAYELRIDWERDMTRKIMYSSGNYKNTNPQRLWPLSIDRTNKEYVTPEEVADKKQDALQIAQERMEAMKVMQSKQV